MPIAAVPAYLGMDFKDASPALRFGMYLKLWGINRRSNALLWTTHDVIYEVRGQEKQEREVRDENKTEALKTATRLNEIDEQANLSLSQRQAALAATMPAASLLCLNAQAISPFTTGLGNEHPLENGFAFLNPYGLPYVPGSGVKGVLRQAAQELASGQWGETYGWSRSNERPYRINLGTEREPRWLDLSMIDVLFGRETREADKDHVRGALSFWDVIPQIAGESLLVEIMTPHQSHYYQQRSQAGSTNPHDSGQPNPICFLTVPPGSRFTFYVVCDVNHLRRLTQHTSSEAPDLLAEGETHWKTLLNAAFQHAFHWLGFGAKTAVGYGAMKPDVAASSTTAASGPHGVSTASPGSAPHAQPVPSIPARPQLTEAVWESATITHNKGGGGVVTVQSTKGKAEARGEAAQAFLQTLSDAQRQRLQKKGQLTSVSVVVRIEGNRRTPLRLAPQGKSGGAE
jgi:CRISPR-associated protein Cmr6